MNQSLEAVNLECMRGDRRLFAGVGLRLEPGQLLHIKGPNGSGKTTLLRMLCGLVRPEGGEIFWHGEKIRSLAEDYLAEVTYVGHQNAIKADLTGRENLRMQGALMGHPIDDGQAADALRRMGLKGCDRLPAKVLSQGQKRRTALARLLIAKTCLWVLDEPFVALDVRAVATLQEAILAHLDGNGMVVLTTHQEVELDASRSQVLDLGARS